MKHWLKILLSLIPMVVVVCLVAQAFRVPWIAYERIHEGMTIAEVEAELGPPTCGMNPYMADSCWSQWQKPGCRIDVVYINVEWSGTRLVVSEKRIKKSERATAVWLRRTLGI